MAIAFACAFCLSCLSWKGERTLSTDACGCLTGHSCALVLSSQWNQWHCICYSCSCTCTRSLPFAPVLWFSGQRADESYDECTCVKAGVTTVHSPALQVVLSPYFLLAQPPRAGDFSSSSSHVFPRWPRCKRKEGGRRSFLLPFLPSTRVDQVRRQRERERERERAVRLMMRHKNATSTCFIKASLASVLLSSPPC